MTLRELLQSVIPAKVYRHINKKDSRNAAKCDRPTMEQTVKAYTAVIAELLQKPKSRKYHMPILVKWSEDWYDHHKYPDVCFLNPKYVAPPKGYKPWGGSRGKPAPKGHYDCNANKHNKTFAMGFTPWSRLIDTPVVNEGGFTDEQLVAEILWELTFYGWTEKKVDVRVKEIEGKIKEAMKEVKQGKCIELPPKKKGGYKVVIPEIVQKQIAEIMTKNKKKKL